MTLIASYITKFGVIQVSDSNLTDDKGNAGFGQKIFPITYLNASLAYSGSYSVSGKNLDKWMNEFITSVFFTCKTIEEFAKELCRVLTSEMRAEEIKIGTIIHLVGYSTHSDQAYLEHWHVSNVKLDLQTGIYSEPSYSFHVNLDFNSFKFPEHRKWLKELDYNPSKYHWFINGFPPGRISAVIIKIAVDEALDKIWNNPNWKFNPPNTIFDFVHIVKRYFEFVTNLFPLSDYNALYVGGDIQTYLIPVPQNLNND